MNISIGICVHNEEKNIGKLLKSLIEQKEEKIKIKEIIVVSSGSTDNTDKIVANFSRKDSRIKLLIQKKREGKVSAVNLFIKNATGNVLILISGDVLPADNLFIEKLVYPFFDLNVGMTGCKVIPTNNENCLMGYISHLIWKLHHHISLMNKKMPKLGECIAFRNGLVKEIPKEMAVDEAWIQAEAFKKGYNVVYVPEAVIYNRGPETISDFIKQRRRIYAGHLQLKDKLRVEMPTMSIKNVIKSLIKIVELNPKYLVYLFVGVILEGYARFLGAWDYYIRKKDHAIWDIAESTKKLEV